jgi:deazaflavin-dependent oxidoreductase (nitroreductase family)
MTDRNEFNKGIVEEFRSNGGVVGGMFDGMPMIIVTHRGAKSGTQYETPLVFSRDGDDVIVIASKGGAPEHPQWFHNLVANPDVTVEVGTERYPATAIVAEGDDRALLYDAQVAQMPQFDEYRQKTAREIPVVILRRA